MTSQLFPEHQFSLCLITADVKQGHGKHATSSVREAGLLEPGPRKCWYPLLWVSRNSWISLNVSLAQRTLFFKLSGAHWLYGVAQSRSLNWERKQQNYSLRIPTSVFLVLQQRVRHLRIWNQSVISDYSNENQKSTAVLGDQPHWGIVNHPGKVHQ